jgi:phospholipid transport system substrate-binding protein
MREISTWVQQIQSMGTRVIYLLTSLAVGSGVFASDATERITRQATAGPQEVIAELSARLFAALEQEPYTFRHNDDKTLPLIDRLLAPHFDVAYTARLVLGPYWNGATADQRQRFAEAFYQRLLRTYVGAVADWTAERFRLLPLHSDAAALQVTVHTLIRTPSGAITAVDYRMRQTPEGWKIFDVVVEGVSYARSYHDDVNADVARNGIDVATARLVKHDQGNGTHQLPDQQRAQ